LSSIYPDESADPIYERTASLWKLCEDGALCIVATVQEKAALVIIAAIEIEPHLAVSVFCRLAPACA
jgi:predicted RNase H-like nuclease